MYRLIRSVSIKAGKNVEVRQVAQEIADYINKNYSQAKVQIGNQMFGDLAKIFWFGDIESLASLEELNQKLQMDQAYQGIVAKLADISIEGSAKDMLFNIP